MGSSAAFAGLWTLYALITLLPADLFMHIGLGALLVYAIRIAPRR
jgi:hypothetical protein